MASMNKRTIFFVSEGTMFKKLFVGLFVFVLLLGSVSVMAAGGGFTTGGSPEYREGYLLVRFTEEGTTASAQANRLAVLQSAGGGTIARSYTLVPGLTLVQLPSGTTVAEARIRFSATLGIRYAEPDFFGYYTAVPNDPQFNRLWGLNNTGQTIEGVAGVADADIDAPEAWNIVKDNSTVLVAVCDSGIDYTHPDLAANMWINQAEANGQAGVDDDNNGYIDDIRGWDFAFGDNEPEDNVGHGTHVAGTIGAVGNNGVGVTGVNWSVKIVPIKIGDFFIATSGAIEGIQYAIKVGAKVMNHSWGGSGYSQALYDAITQSQEAGLLFVAAAGNYSMDNDVTPFYPCSYDLDSIISVMATDNQDEKTSFSHWGKTGVDIGAPGQGILSTIPNNGYDYYDGTSMACPHVAGAAALVWSLNSQLTYQETKQILMTSVDKLDSLEGRSVTEGRLNLYKASLLAQSSDALPPLPDPAEWLIEPQATGLTTIVMQAKKATDKSGVEYFFECIENHTFDSGWQSSAVYQKSTFAAGTAYSFRVKARDKSENLNQTEWSQTITTTTATGVDNLPPAPNPSQWVSFPRVTSVPRKQIGMEILTSYDENGVEYYFDCVLSDDPAWVADNTKYDSGWRTSPSYTVTVASVADYEYTFIGKARQLGTTDAIHETAVTESTKVGEASHSMVRVVPSAAYQTIQAAIDSSRTGDTVVVLPGIHREINISFRGKAITVCSQNPNDPAVVAATVIDCEDIWDYPSNLFETRRAFVFQDGEGRNSVLAGLTIRNATAVDDATIRLVYTSVRGDPDQGDRYMGAEGIDGRDAAGGAILMGFLIYNYGNEITGSYSPASPTIRNCVFENCSANGQYGWNGLNGVSVEGVKSGGHADRGGNGGNAYGGAIYAVSGSSPLIEGCQFTTCQAVGGDAGNGGNGADGGDAGDDEVNGNGGNGGDGGDAGFGGCGWGGAVYFEQDCSPELHDTVVEDCFVQVGQAGIGGHGGNGGDGKGFGFGGNGGNGGAGGDLRASSSYAGAVYYGDNANATIEGCEFKNCRVIVELSGVPRTDDAGVIIGYDYNGGDGGDGGKGEDDGGGGHGGHGGPAYFVPDKLRDLGGGVTATGGTGGDGGEGGLAGLPGNGGFRFGVPGTGRAGYFGANFSLLRQQTGIWPSNMYYLSYYWEDTDNINTLNSTTDLNDYLDMSWDWKWPDYSELAANIVITVPPIPADPNANPATESVPGEATSSGTIYVIFDSASSPFYGLLECTYNYEGIIVLDEDTEHPGEPEYYTYDYREADFVRDPDTFLPVYTPVEFIPLTHIDPDQPNSGACAGANYYGEGSVVVMKDTIVSDNTSFANHAGGELYDRGCQATIENCTFENNTTVYQTTIESDYKFEGLGGGVFADQPVSMTFTGCSFNNNNAFGGGGLYCNFAPTTEDADAALDLTDTVFSGNKADHHLSKSYAGGVYAGNSFDPYEEFYFNDFDGYDDFVMSRYVDHGYITFYNGIQTLLWDDVLEADSILWDMIDARNSVAVADCNFIDNLSPYGAGLYLDSSVADVNETQFWSNTAHAGAGGFLFACNVTAQDNLFAHNTAQEVPTQSPGSQQEAGTVQIIGSGAGLYLASCDSFLTNNHFAANETNGSGAALYIAGWSPTGYPQSVFNCLFVENQAQYAGGALLAERGTDVEVLNSTFVDNEVIDYYGYGGAVLANDAYMSITNTIFRDNSALLGPQLCVGEPLDTSGVFTTVYLDYSNIQGGQDEVYVEASGYPWLDYGMHNIEDAPATSEDESDPQFVETGEPTNAVDRTFYLAEIAAGQLSTSPCVDAGTPTHFIYDPAVGDFIEIPGAAGSVLEWLAAKLGFDITTRTDHVADASPIDMGYHYNATQSSAKEYTLTLVVDRGSDDPLMTRLKGTGGGLDPFVLYSPDSRTVKAGTQVALEAILNDPFYTVKAWHNTDDDASTAITNSVRMTANKTVILECETTIPTLRTRVVKGSGTVTPAGVTLWPKGTVVPLKATPTNPSDIVRWLGTDDDALLGTTNTVTMTESKDVDVEFYTPTVYDVTGDFTELQHAIYDAKEGDIIMLRPGVYTPVQGLHLVFDKNIVIQSYNPDDPDTVANTVIQGCGFIMSGTGRKMVLNGITLQDAHYGGGGGCDDCGPTHDGGNGGSIGGGAIEFIADASATVKNCRFVSCSITGGNGGKGGTGGDGGWGGWARGGAVYVDSGDPRFINCEFADNYVRGGGGGDAGDDGIRGGSWDEVLNPWYGWDFGPYLPYWKYSGYGGAVYCDEDSAAEFKNCLFSNNIAYGGHTGSGFIPRGWYKIDRYGGAIYAAQRSSLTLTECTFEDNHADTVGPTETYTHTSPKQTTQEDPYFAYGGTIAFEDDAVVTLKDCVIEGGLAHHGGGIYAEHATLQVSDCNFIDNTASFGGAVFYVDTKATIEKTVFQENTANLDASQGGALSAFDANSIFTDVVVVNNTSGRSGGGFYVSGSDQTTIKNGLFAGNSAGRDGGGLSVNWYSDVTIDNCTFADNDVPGAGSGMSQGGGVFVGYQSYADIIDSIVWGNLATTGQQIAVTTGFEFDPAPSSVTLSYTDVENYPNSNAVYVYSPSTLDPGVGIFSTDPLFVKLPGSTLADIVSDYYLDQADSPCKDKGSQSSMVKGLFEYTTSIEGIQDKGVVDLGYHYETATARAFCSYADMADLANGRIELADWAVFASWWLEGPCIEGDAIVGGNNWCGGADLNFNSYIDTEDLMLFVSCWLQQDSESPSPNPAEWALGGEPAVTEDDTVLMEAMQAVDKWGGVEYYFEASTAQGLSHNSGWRQSFDPARPGYVFSAADQTVRAWIFEDTGLTDGTEYTYVVRVRDVAGNLTADSRPVSVTPGIDSMKPVPNPAEWKDINQPYQVSNTSLRMEAKQATDASGVEYRFVCEEDGNLSSGWRQNVAPAEIATYFATPWLYQVDGLRLGDTYTFYTITRDRADIPNITEKSVSRAVTMVEIDSTAPTPNPSTWAVPPTKQFINGIWYHYMRLTAATDDSGVEYQFRRVDGPGLSETDGQWWNDANVTGIIDPDGSFRLPNELWLNVGVQSLNYSYQGRTRDQSVIQNTGDWSPTVVAQ